MNMNTQHETFNEVLQVLNNAYQENVRQINRLQADNVRILETIVTEYHELSRPSETESEPATNFNNQIIQLLSSALNANTNTNTNANTPAPSVRVTRNNPVSRIQYFQTILPQFRNETTNAGMPTQQQIEQATFTTPYNNIESPSNNSCPISLEPFQPEDNVTIIRYCGHVFNPNSLVTWFQRHSRCPMCRYDIKTYVPSQGVLNYHLHDNSLNSLPLPTISSSSTQESQESQNTRLRNVRANYDSIIDELLSSVFHA